MTDRPADAPDAEIVCPARPESLAALLAFVAEASARAGLDRDSTFAVRLAAEEVCTNVIAHAYPNGAAGPVRLRFRRDPAAVLVTVEDLGIPFDPAQVARPAADAAWEARPIGGMGWHLVRESVDEVRHEHLPGGGNRLTLVKRLSPDP